MRRLLSVRHRHRQFRIGLASVALAAIGIVGCAPEAANTDPVAEEPTLEIVEPSGSTDAPSEEVTVLAVDADAFRKTVEGLKGKVVLVDFWATWCGPCTEQFPHTVSKASELAPRGFAAVSMSFDDPEDPDTILEFLKEQKAGAVTNLVSQHGASPESNEAFDVGGGIPWYQLYDRSGALKYVFCDAPESGLEALPVAELDAKIEELLAEPQT